MRTSEPVGENIHILEDHMQRLVAEAVEAVVSDVKCRGVRLQSISCHSYSDCSLLLARLAPVIDQQRLERQEDIFCYTTSS